jgi:hypothetical protein
MHKNPLFTLYVTTVVGNAGIESLGNGHLTTLVTRIAVMMGTVSTKLRQ